MNEKQPGLLCIYCENPLEINTSQSLPMQISTAICHTCKSIKLVGSSHPLICPICFSSIYFIASDKTDISICSNPYCPEYSIHRDRLERGDIISWKSSNLLILDRWISFWSRYGGNTDRIEMDSPAYPRLYTLLSSVQKRLK